jgi:hypothetical protein
VLTRGPILLVVLGWSLAFRWRCHWTWCLVTAVAVGVLGMSKYGGLANHLLAASFVAATVVGRWLGGMWAGAGPLGGDEEAPRAERGTDDGNRQSAFGFRRMGLGTGLRHWAVIAALGLAVWPGLPTPRGFRWLRTRAREAREWTDAVQRFDGRAAVSHHLLLARRAGADCFFSDLILQFPGLRVPASVREQIAIQRFDYLILEADPVKSPTAGWSELLLTHYAPTGELDCPNRSGVLPRRVYVARRLGVSTVRRNKPSS